MSPTISPSAKPVNRGGLVLQHNNGTEDQRKKQNLLDFYDVDSKILGTGSYGSVAKATNKITGAVRACKAMAKKSIKNEKRFREEIELMKQMDHPNIVRLYETFEDHKNVYLIMELCTGGELFDRIVKKGQLSESESADIARSMLSALFYMHEAGMVHRDLKPENFLLSSKGPDAELKVIDFGLGARYVKGQGNYMSTRAGTPYYVSPQVLAGKYTEKCDIWSAGVIIFVLLGGYPPFHGAKDTEILSKVKKGDYKFPSKKKEGIEFSKEAQHLIASMLSMDEAKRPSAEECLKHPWILKHAGKKDVALAAGDKSQSKVVNNFMAFQGGQRFKKLALTSIASQLTEKEIKSLKEVFLALDKNRDGTLSFEEIKQGCKELKITLPANMDAVLQQIDSDNSGQIEYIEFIAASMEAQHTHREDLCWAAFRVFDVDGDGKITPEELAKALGSGILTEDDKKEALAMIKEYDVNGDGEIDFKEFVAMVRDMKLDPRKMK